MMHILMKYFIGKYEIKKSEHGFVLITVILFLAIFMLLSFMLLYKITSTVKISGITKMEMIRYHGAEGGILSVASYMAKFKETNPPPEVLKVDRPNGYEVNVRPLGNTIRYPVGFSSLWKGADMKINSVSPARPNDKTELEMVVFVPLTPVGYGNE